MLDRYQAEIQEDDQSLKERDDAVREMHKEVLEREAALRARVGRILWMLAAADITSDNWNC
jgi:hypothetical protein